LNESLARWAPVALSVLRIVAAFLFLEHGTQKLLGIPDGKMANVPMSAGLPWWAGLIEIVTGVLMLIGFLTRPAAFLASGTMAAAYWIAHAPQNPFPVNNQGDAAILYCFVFLYVVFAGAGAWSVDAMRSPTKPRGILGR
jgi:putative oxidoreductase